MDNTPAKVLTKRATVLKIRNKVLAIEKVFKNSLAYQIVAKQKDQKQKIKIRILNGEEERRKKKTSNLEKIRNKLSLRTGVGEGAANFLTNTLMGFLFTAIVPALPKLSGIINALKPAAWFVSALTNLFLNTIGGFIDTGYKLHDTIKGTSENIKKIPIKKEFDEFQTNLSKSLGSVVDVVYGITGSKPPTQQAKEQTKKPVKGAAVGGPIAYTPPSRKLKKSQELNIPRKQTIPETKIGKDVGGEGKVREFYGSPKVGFGGILGIFKPKNAPLTKTPVDSISNISKTLRRRNLLFGDISSVGSDIALGQKPNKNVYRNTAKDVIELAQMISEKQQNSAIAMATGGSVPSRSLTLASRGNVVDAVATVIQKSVDDRVNRAMADFRRPVGKEEMLEENQKRTGGGSYESGGSSGVAGGIYGGYQPRGEMEKKIYDYLTKEKKLNDIQALGLMANIERESSFRPGIKEKGGTGHGLFQWSHGRIAPFIRAVPDWQTNWKAQIDYALSEPESLSMVKPGEYASKTFASAQEAADWWMREWERPADIISGSRKHSGYLKGIPKGPTGSAMFRAPERAENSEVEAKSKGFRSGLKTGPSGRIGSGTAYHVDARFVEGISLKDKIAMIDSMASAHAAEGYVMEFSGRGVSSLRWNPNSSQKEKEDLARRVLVSHHSARAGYEPFDYFVVKQNVRDRFAGGKDLSVSGIAGANIMAPRLSGGSYEYQEQPGGYGRFLILRDKNGKVLMEIGHGDLGVPSPRELGRRFNMDELEEKSSGLAMKEGKQGVIINGKFKARKWTDEENERYKQNIKNQNVQQQKTNVDDKKKQKITPTNKKTKPGQNESQQPNLLQQFQSNIRKITGFKKGGSVGNISNYASYENTGGSVIIAIQPMIIQKETLVDHKIPVSFPVPSRVNNNTNYRA
jgi:hypothetical protein